MTRSMLSGRDQRALRLGALALAPVLVFSLVIRPYQREIARAQDQLDEQRALLVRERRLLREASTFPNRRQRAAAALGANWTRIVRGTDTVSVAASFAGYVSNAAEDAGLLIEQVDARSADSTSAARLSAGGLSATTVELRARGDLERILHFIADIESGETIARIDKLALVRQGSPAESSDQEVLGVTVTATGIARILTRPASAARLPARERVVATNARPAP